MKLRTVDDALRTLERLAERGEISVRDVAAELECSRSSAYRIVRTLMDRGWIAEARPGEYELGRLALMLGTRAIKQHSLREVALPSMRALRDATDETVTLSVLVGTERVCIEQLESSKQVRMKVAVGHPYPLYAGASGKAILAAMDADDLARYIARTRLAKLAPNTIQSRAKLARSVADAASRGYVVSVAERDPEAFSIAAPITGPDGVVGSIAMCGPASRFVEADAARYGRRVKDAAAEISIALGQARVARIERTRRAG